MINLKSLSQFVHTEHFTMETITNLRTMLSKDDWIVTIDISEAYLTIPLDEEFKDCHFPISGSDLPISVYAFWPKRCCKGLHKNHEAACGQSKSSGLQDSSIFKRLDSYCPNKAFMSKTIPIFSKFSPEARLQNKLRKSSLAPSQIKEWLGFVIDSRSMTISLPQKK